MAAARGKEKMQTHLKKVENAARRRVVFFKRRNGLLKKAFELSTLCDAEVAVLIFSESGKLYEFANRGMQGTLKRYIQATGVAACSEHIANNNAGQIPASKAHNLLKKITVLRGKQKNMMGEDIDSLSRKRLDKLEKQLQIAVSRVYHRKIVLLSEMSRLLSEEVNTALNENRRLKEEMGDSGASLAMPLIDSLPRTEKMQTITGQDCHEHGKFNASKENCIFSWVKTDRSLN